MVFDFRLPDQALFDAMRLMGERGGMLQVHCEDPVLLDSAVAASLQRGDVLPRYHATSRPPYVEAVATARALAFARATDSPVHVVHLSSAAALDEVRRAKAAGVRVTAETCPHYLTLTDAEYEEPDPTRCACYVISPPLRSAADRDALWVGLADGSLDLVATDHVPDRVGVEKAEAAKGIPFDRISNGAPGIETLLALVYSEGVARGRLTLERMVDLLATTPAARFGLARKGAIEVGRDADIVVFDQTRDADAARRRPPPHERLHALRGLGRLAARSVTSSSAAPTSSATVPSSAAAAPASSSNEAPSRLSSPINDAGAITADAQILRPERLFPGDARRRHHRWSRRALRRAQSQPPGDPQRPGGCGASGSSPPIAATSFAKPAEANARELAGLQATDRRLREAGRSRQVALGPPDPVSPPLDHAADDLPAALDVRVLVQGSTPCHRR